MAAGPRQSLPRAALAYFALVFGTGFVLGALRVTLLVPRLGVRAAELVEMPLMLIAIVFAARAVVSRFPLAPTPRQCLAVGGMALVLLLAAELTFARLLAGQSPAAWLASRDAVSGPVYFAMLGLFAIMPRLVRR